MANGCIVLGKGQGDPGVEGLGKITMSESVKPADEARGRVRNPQDFWGGLVLAALAGFALWAARDLPGMRGFAFGPGTAPRLFAYILGGLGLLIAGMGLLTHGPRIERYRVRGPVFIIGAILIFAFTIRSLGLVIASFLCVVTCALAAEDFRWKETILWAVVLTAFCSVLFPYGLNLPFQLWPRF